MKKKHKSPSRECSRNFVITNDIDRKLDMMAKHRDMSRSQLVRALIVVEFEKDAALSLRTLPRSNRT